MAGSPAGRAYRPSMSQGWAPLGFREVTQRATQGQKDLRVPAVSNQLNSLAAMGWQGLQLRHYLPLLSQRFNITDASTKLAEQKHQLLQLSNKNTGTGLGSGRLKALNTSAPTNPTNLLAKATRYGRFPNKVMVTANSAQAPHGLPHGS